jgi:ABC-type molybdate transport system ATPase subunit
VCGFDHAREEVAVKQRAAYVGPDLNFAAWGRVGKAIRFIRGFRPTWDEAYCARLMEVLGLAADERISTLSFGARTKLALLLALAWHPQVLVLDEPTTGLDAHSKKVVFTELLAMVCVIPMAFAGRSPLGLVAAVALGLAAGVIAYRVIHRGLRHSTAFHQTRRMFGMAVGQAATR